VSAPTPGRALDLEAIEATLQDLQLHFPEINKLLKSRRDTIDDGLIANMMTGYELVDNLVTRHLDLFAMGNLKLFLEMNAVVLCGRDEQSRTQAASHLAATNNDFTNKKMAAYATLSSGMNSTGRNRRGSAPQGSMSACSANPSCSSRAITARMRSS
jgi:hypothetical protein